MEHKPDAMVPENLMTTLVRRGRLGLVRAISRGFCLDRAIDRVNWTIVDRRVGTGLHSGRPVVVSRLETGLHLSPERRHVVVWMLNTVRTCTYPRKVNALMLAVRASKVAMHGDYVQTGGGNNFFRYGQPK
jgi:hypothetical protein